MLLDMKKGVPYCFVIYYTDKDYNEDIQWVSVFYSKEDYEEWEKQAEEEQPYTGLNWRVYLHNGTKPQ